MEYAKNTKVSVAQTKADIEAAMRRWGADGFMSSWEGDISTVAFKYKGLEARISLAMPDRDSEEILFTPARRFMRGVEEQKKAYEQAVRQRWRALLIYIKANLEAIDSGIISFEQAFLPHFVLNDGRTVTDSLMPQIYNALEAGELLPMLSQGHF